MSCASRWAMALIRRYQRSGGGVRLFGIDCNFDPSCSEYTYQALQRFGFRRGLRLGMARIHRCNRRDLTHKEQDPLPSCEQKPNVS